MACARTLALQLSRVKLFAREKKYKTYGSACLNAFAGVFQTVDSRVILTFSSTYLGISKVDHLGTAEKTVTLPGSDNLRSSRGPASRISLETFHLQARCMKPYVMSSWSEIHQPES